MVNIKNKLNKIKLVKRFIEKNRINLIRIFLVGIFLLIVTGIFLGVQKILADTIVDQLFTGLQNKLGFEFNPDPSSDYIFSKITPNYNAYSGDRKSAGGHRLLLERDGNKVEMIFLSAENSSSSEALLSATSSPQTITPSQPPIEASASSSFQKTLDYVNAQLKDISSGLQNVTKEIASIERNVSSIVSKAKLVPDKGDRIILYQDIIIGTDVSYSLNEGGTEQKIVLNNKDKLNNVFNFTLATDMKYTDKRKGIWYFPDGKGKDIMRIPKGWLTDGAGAVNNNVDIKIYPYLWINKMTITVPLDWLQAPERVYPVTIHTGLEIVPELRDGKNGQVVSPTIEISPIATSTPSINMPTDILSPTSTASPIPTETITPLELAPTKESSGSGLEN